MKRIALNLMLLGSIFAAPVMVGCDRTVSEDKTTTQKPDGSTEKTEQKTVETPDGGTKTTSEHTVNNANK
jgi:hypothetical protein